MLRYISKRLQQAAITVLVLILFTFVAVRVTGDPTLTMLPQTASDNDRIELRQRLHLDEALWKQFGFYVADIATGDFGHSYKWDVPVRDLLLERFSVTLKLALISGALTLLLGVPMGVAAACWRGRFVDHLVLIVALIGQSVPLFVTAIVSILIFSVKLQWLPVTGISSPLGYVLPSIALGWYGLAAIIRITRVSMLNALSSEYILTATAKGLSRFVIIYHHALPNALVSVVTIFGLILATLLTGTVVVETLFSLPGLGRLAIEAISGRDFPVVQGVVLVTTVIYILVNLGVDILYGIIDPRMASSSR
jgi:peptide/nickel transport system permease protein